MRPIGWAIAVLGLLLLPASPAAAGAVRLTRVARTVSPAVGGGGQGGYAYLATPTSLVVQTTAARRTYPVAPDCAPTALARDAVALACPDVGEPVVMALETGRFTAVSIPPGAGIRPLALGTDWMLADDQFSPDGVHGEETTYALNWRSGRIVDLGGADPLGRGAYPDLDATGLRTPLCRPAVRLSYGNLGPFDQTRYATVDKVGPWLLETTGRSFVVKRCGRLGDAVHLTAGGSLTQASLGPGTLAYVDHRHIEVENLATRRTASIPWPGPAAGLPEIGLSGRRLVVSSPAADGTYTIYEGP